MEQELKQEIGEIKKQMTNLTKLIEEHIQSETDLVNAWNGFNWSKKTGIQIITIIGTIVGILWGIIQIIRWIK